MTVSTKLSGPSTTPWRQKPAERWQPHAYQLKAAKFLVPRTAAALFLDPGLGKTSVALAALLALLKREFARRILVIAPLRVCYGVWPAEVSRWSDFEQLRVSILHGQKKDAALEAKADLYVINPEGLPWLLGAGRDGVPNFKRWRSLAFDTLVVDELSKFKHTNTKRFKLLRQVLPTFKRRWGLTGSPAANGLLDLFGQCYVLDLGAALGRFITHYRSQFFVPTGYQGYDWKLREGAEAEINARVAPLALRMSAEDYLELPAVVNNYLRVDLPTGARRVYQQLEDDLLAELAEGTITAASAGAASVKCRQAASGAVYLDPDDVPLVRPQCSGRRWAELHDEKITVLADLIGELQGEPLLVAYEFEHDLVRIQKALGDIPHIGGGVSAHRGEQLCASWNRGELPVLLAHPASLAHGVNLQERGRHICWFTLTWNFEYYDQLIRRLRRQGSRSKHIFVHHIIARDTLDEAVLSSLRAKERGQSSFFQALQELVRGRRAKAC